MVGESLKSKDREDFYHDKSYFADMARNARFKNVTLPQEGDGHEAPPRHEEEGRRGGGADEGDAEEVSPSWALISKGRVSWRIDSSTATCGPVRWLSVCRAFCISVSYICTH